MRFTLLSVGVLPLWYSFWVSIDRLAALVGCVVDTVCYSSNPLLSMAVASTERSMTGTSRVGTTIATSRPPSRAGLRLTGLDEKGVAARTLIPPFCYRGWPIVMLPMCRCRWQVQD